MTWQRLSQRASGTRSDGPYEGVPGHISGPLGDWLFEILQNASIASTVAIQLRVGMSSGLPEFKVARLLVAAASGDQNLCLDMADAVLHFVGNYGGAADRLRLILALGASVWTVADGDDSLMLVVQDETQAASSKQRPFMTTRLTSCAPRGRTHSAAMAILRTPGITRSRPSRTF